MECVVYLTIYQNTIAKPAIRLGSMQEEVYLENIFKALKEQNIGNVVVAWYIANDSSVGINILIKGYGIKD